MLFKSLLLSQASGSIAGAVFSHNQGGMYMRARATPTNPNTEPQQAVRDAMRQAVDYWSNTLTDVQREAWNTYAFNTPTLNRLGESTHKTGQQMFIRGTVPRLQAGMTVPTAAPTSYDVGSFNTPFDMVADASSSDVSGSIDAEFGWGIEATSALLIYQSRPQNATRNFSKGPYLLAQIVPGVAITGVDSWQFTSLFPLGVGTKLFLKFNVTRGDGRFSGATILNTIVVA